MHEAYAFMCLSLSLIYFMLQEFRKKSNDNTELAVLNTKNFHSVAIDVLDFLKDIYSWKWHWACGKRYLLIGLGVSNFRALIQFSTIRLSQVC